MEGKYIGGSEIARIAFRAFAFHKWNKKMNGLSRGKECEILTEQHGCNPADPADTPEWLKSRVDANFFEKPKNIDHEQGRK